MKDFLTPGLRYKPPYGPLDLISLGMALIFGTAGLPHILVRFYTVPDAKTARYSVVWAMVLIGSFYIMTTFLGFGAATIVGRDYIVKNGGNNMSAPLLAQAIGGDVFFAFISRDSLCDHTGRRRRTDNLRLDFICARCVDQYHSPAARNTIRAKSVGSRALRHLSWERLPLRLRSCWAHRQRRLPGRAGFCRGCFGESSGDRVLDFLEAFQHRRRGLGTRYSARWVHRPDLHRSQHHGRGCAHGCGRRASHDSTRAHLPAGKSGILSIPIGFAGALLGTFLGAKDENSVQRFEELEVHANTGLGSEKATAH